VPGVTRGDLDRRARRSQRSRAAIVDAVHAVGEGIVQPTAQQVASARRGARSVFRHFSDMGPARRGRPARARAALPLLEAEPPRGCASARAS
jgi:hypothetical protein